MEKRREGGMKGGEEEGGMKGGEEEGGMKGGEEKAMRKYSVMWFCDVNAATL